VASVTKVIDTRLVISQADILITIFTSVLIIAFFLFVRKILIYYEIYKLTIYLIDKDKKSNPEEDEYKYFTGVSELLQWSIKMQNDKIAKTISDYFYSCFQNYRDTSYDYNNGYPNLYYDAVYKTTQELLLITDNKLKYLESRSAGGIWLLGEFSKIRVSENTYAWIWRNLISAVNFKRDDIVLSYWRTAFQYFSYSLSPIDKIHSEDFKDLLNEAEIEQREKERERFLEFHYALGGLLLSQRRYDCIHRIFRFTQSDPPEYVLSPQTMTEVFNQYFRFRNSLDKDLLWISGKYGFPNLDGMDSDDIIRNWICKYIAILFLRQYTLIQYYTVQNHVSTPSLPEEQGEKSFWLEHIDYFKKLVFTIRSDESLMNELGFKFYGNISDEWCVENNKETPTALIESTKQAIKESFEQTKIEQVLSEEKTKEFYTSTERIVKRLFDKYKMLTNLTTIENDYHSWCTNGTQAVFDKGVFCENQEIGYVDYDSILAKSYVHELNYSISQQFEMKITQRYLLTNEDVFNGIDRFKIKNPKDYVIIAFDVNFSFFDAIDGLDLENNKYKELDIYKINGAFTPLKQSFVIVKKVSLPHFIYRDISEEMKQKFELKLLDDDYKIYAAIIDLNKRPDLHNEIGFQKDVDIRTQVLAVIDMSTEFSSTLTD
jgi:hypothetical protein